MAKDGKPGDTSWKTETPRLRFPEFADEELRDVQLGDVTEDCTERNGKNKTRLPIMGVSKSDGIVPMQERLIGKDIARYKRLEKNCFAYNPMRLNIGSIARWKGDGDVLVSPDYVVFRCLTEGNSPIDPAYLDHFRCSDQWEDFVAESGDGGVRIRIYYKDLARLPLRLPSSAEQQKIAECLTSLDDLITAQEKKLELLKAHKKGLMQQLFPQATPPPNLTHEFHPKLPRCRFPEFRDAPDWTETSVEHLADIQSGGTPSKANPGFWNGSIPWVSAKDMKRLFLEDSEDHISMAAVDDGARMVPAGTLLILTRGMTLLKDVPICVLRREMTFNQDAKALRPKVNVNGLFLALLLLGNKDRLLKMVDVAGHGTGKLNTDELRAFELVTPSPAEQQRIADCLFSIDTQFSAESEKLDALKTHKKGLMQQLFPSPEVN